MSKLYLALGLAAIILTAGCPNSKLETSDQSISIVKTTRLHFAGFAKSKSGATWMAWPDAVNEALAELPGIKEVQMKLEQDEFVVSYDASKVHEKELLAACEKSGFPATIATGTEYSGLAAVEKSNADFSPPDFYTEALETAKRDGKPIVLDFMATWCAPCKRIATETFAEENGRECRKVVGRLYIAKDRH